MIDNMAEDRADRIILSDTETLARGAQEVKARGIKPDFERRDGDKFVLTVTRYSRLMDG